LKAIQRKDRHVEQLAPAAQASGHSPRHGLPGEDLLIGGAIIIVLILAAIGGLFDSTAGEVHSNPDVYERIGAETDCGVLQAEFDQAMDNAEARQPGDPLRDISLDYADAADARLEEVGCYG